ncbi:hypothetical protein BC351_06425 [Paenibacillus ferrarius]|uniref:Uncharacterized protein n=1 Tax=Paenibacillus ferrarius TaxID=1469647 RepID=A0A1V4HH50_9BACL|nr:hypothetical protein [Paenibacillus ferrarius]OPH53497.1 hypothetical protein BC351_06425 [Paenibacillus ferrarius]
MSKDRYFKILASVVAACVLLLVFFLIVVVGLALNSFATYLIMLIVIFIGAAEVFGFYQAFIARSTSSIRFPYKLALVTTTQLFAAIELTLIGIYARFALSDALDHFVRKLPAAIETTQLKISGSYSVLALLGVALYVITYASILYAADHSTNELENEELQKANTRDVAATLSHIILSYNQLAGEYQSLDFSKTKVLYDKLTIKSRALGVFGRSDKPEVEWDVILSCNELRDRLKALQSQKHMEQEHVNEIYQKTSRILDEILTMDRVRIQ